MKDHRYNHCRCGRQKGWSSKQCRTCRRDNTRSPQTAKAIQLFAAGVPRKGIAAEMGIAHKTVEYHLAKARKQLGLPSDVHLVHWAIRNRLVKFIA